ncbi:MAG: DUF4062 domain-containing protein [Chloroflexi bacterium]|nr:DUF4062 domain-containing protein [Chloroflexota bacterium]
MAQRIDVMVSSTFKDFETHRKGVFEGIMRLGMHPLMMEFMNASDADALTESLRMVDEAEIYLGILGFRYGYVPNDPRNPDRLSITELEYRRAGERGIHACASSWTRRTRSPWPTPKKTATTRWRSRGARTGWPR